MLLSWFKAEFQRFRGRLRVRLETPFPDCFDYRIGQEGVPAQNLCFFYRSVGSDRELDLYGSRDFHAAREIGICGLDPAYDFAATFFTRSFLLRPQPGSEARGDDRDRQQTQYQNAPPATKGHIPSSSHH